MHTIFVPLVDFSSTVDRKRAFIILGLKDLNFRLHLRKKQQQTVNIESSPTETERE